MWSSFAYKAAGIVWVLLSIFLKAGINFIRLMTSRIWLRETNEHKKNKFPWNERFSAEMKKIEKKKRTPKIKLVCNKSECRIINILPLNSFKSI